MVSSGCHPIIRLFSQISSVNVGLAFRSTTGERMMEIENSEADDVTEKLKKIKDLWDSPSVKSHSMLTIYVKVCVREFVYTQDIENFLNTFFIHNSVFA